MSLASVSSTITYITFQQYKHSDGTQYLAFGEENDGTIGTSIFLYSVPSNLKDPQGDEAGIMAQFWQREIEKCYYQKERKEIRVEEKEKEDEKRQLDELQREQEAQNIDEDAELHKELEEEEKYQQMKLRSQIENNLGTLTQEEYDRIIEEKKKNRDL